MLKIQQPTASICMASKQCHYEAQGNLEMAHRVRTENCVRFSNFFSRKNLLIFQTFQGDFYLHIHNWNTFKSTFCDKRSINLCNEKLYFPGQPHSFQGFFQTFPYLWSLYRLFKAWKISTLNSMIFQTFPGSVWTLGTCMIFFASILVKFHKKKIKLAFHF